MTNISWDEEYDEFGMRLKSKKKQTLIRKRDEEKENSHSFQTDRPLVDFFLKVKPNSNMEEFKTVNPSVEVLCEAALLQMKKAEDYQNPNSEITQADYYPRGLDSLLDTLNSKLLRLRSVTEAMKADPNYGENFESLEDSLLDLINYGSFGVAWCRGQIEGQDLEACGLFSNKPRKNNA